MRQSQESEQYFYNHSKRLFGDIQRYVSHQQFIIQTDNKALALMEQSLPAVEICDDHYYYKGFGFTWRP